MRHFSRDHPDRPSRNERKYSTTWIRANQFGGIRTSTTRPSTTRQPFAARITPPVAIVRTGSAANGAATASSASGSRMESASTTATRASPAALMPVLTAAVLPALRLRTTVRRVRPSAGVYTPSTSPSAGTSSGSSRGSWTRSNRRDKTSNVRSVLPSSTTMISCRGWRRASIACTAVTIPASSLYAGTTSETPCTRRLETRWSRPE